MWQKVRLDHRREGGSAISEKLDTSREIVTLNGRVLRLVSHTTDGKLVLQRGKSGTIVIVDEMGCIDGREYAINREALRAHRWVSSSTPALKPGQPVFCFRFSRKNACLLQAVFVGNVSQSGHFCKIVPSKAIPGREVLKVPRHQLFESVEELREWVARIGAELETLAAG